MSGLKLASLGFAALAFSAVAGAAAADDPAFQDFKRICLDTSDNPAAAQAAATAAGFTPATADQAARFHGPPGAPVYVKTGAPEAVAVGADRMPVGQATYPVHVCTFLLGGSDQAFVDAATAWAGVPPTQIGAGRPPALVFTGPPGHHAPAGALPPAKVIELYKRGELQFIEAGTTANATVLLYLVALPS